MPSLRDAQDARLRAEGTIAAPFGKGASGKQVKLVQEMLCLHDRKVSPDGDFGDATEAALRAFQAASNLEATGRADQNSVEALLQPLLRAIEPDPNPAASLAAQVVRVAKRHLAEHPLEVGGQNAGPWVRLYTDGREGVDWPWCAGFLSYVVGQACRDLRVNRPVKSTVSCDLLAADGQAKGLFVPAGPAVRPEPGWIFLRNRVAGDWDHAGLVAEVNPTFFITVEGNTNDEGSREGFEVCSRARPNGKYDFIRI